MNTVKVFVDGVGFKTLSHQVKHKMGVFIGGQGKPLSLRMLDKWGVGTMPALSENMKNALS